MPTKQQILMGLLMFMLLVIVVVLVIKRPAVVVTETKSVPVATTPPPPPAVEAPAVEAQPPVPPLAPTNAELPPMEEQQEAPTSQTVDAHRAELLRGTSRSRARMSAPTTSALIMNSALTGRDSQGSRQNIGETAMMDRMKPSSEAAPW